MSTSASCEAPALSHCVEEIIPEWASAKHMQGRGVGDGR